MNDIVDMIKVEHLDDNKKIAFLSEQLSLIFSSPNGRRYSPSLIAMAYTLESNKRAAPNKRPAWKLSLKLINGRQQINVRRGKYR